MSIPTLDRLFMFSLSFPTLSTIILSDAMIFLIPSYLYAIVLSPSLSCVTQIWGHIAGFSPPVPTTVRALHFYRGKISAPSCLVGSRRIVYAHARRSQQLILSFWQICSESHHGSIRTHGPILAALESY